MVELFKNIKKLIKGVEGRVDGLDKTQREYAQQHQESHKGVDGDLSHLSNRLEGALHEIERMKEEGIKQGRGYDHMLSAINARLAEYARKLSEAEDSQKQQGTGIAGLESRMSGVEDSQRKSGIVSGAVTPLGTEGITMDMLYALAGEKADAGYKKLRNFFLVEFAKRAYSSDIMPGRIIIKDQDTGLAMEFNQGYCNSVNIWDIPQCDFERSSRAKGSLFAKDKDIGLFIENGDAKTDGIFKEQLAKDLPLIWQAYMIGYALRCFENGRQAEGCQVLARHGIDLETRPELRDRMAEVMKTDANLASAFLKYFPPNQEPGAS